MSQPQYQPSWPQSEQTLITSEVGRHAADLTDDEFDADMAYLRGLTDALFEHATPAHITKLAEAAGIS
jgi:hypothetical protein